MKDMLKQSKTAFLLLTTFICISIILAICWHSLEEIHYLKSFFPERFSVAEAFYASGVELIKVVIIGIPLGLLIFVCLHLLSIFSNKHGGGGLATKR